jgi:hypothetical protein
VEITMSAEQDRADAEQDRADAEREDAADAERRGVPKSAYESIAVLTNAAKRMIAPMPSTCVYRRLAFY